MAKVFITGSTDGLGRASALSLLQAGHPVVLHARSEDRAATLGEVAKASCRSSRWRSQWRDSGRRL
jgi:NAD(P)-dependent dehydrogenase (short-subunit alcohol dehydrogenase family)